MNERHVTIITFFLRLFLCRNRQYKQSVCHFRFTWKCKSYFCPSELQNKEWLALKTDIKLTYRVSMLYLGTHMCIPIHECLNQNLMKNKCEREQRGLYGKVKREEMERKV